MSKLQKIKDHIFKKYQCDILKRVFTVECEGACVRAKVAEDALKGAIDDACDYCTKPKKIYDFWGQEIDLDGTEIS